MNLVDFHCHLDLYPNFPELVQEVERERIYTLAMTTTPKAWPRNFELLSLTKYVRPALGLHPQLVCERENELSVFEKYLPQARYVGEVGLDASSKYYSSFDAQKRVFERILCASSEMGDKILSVHSVRSTKIVLDHIEQFYREGKVVLHWFMGSLSDVKRAVELGCYFSVNSSMMNSEKGQSLVNTLPLDRLLTETDGPFTKIHGRSSVPHDVRDTINMLEKIFQLSAEDIGLRVQANLKSLLKEY